jgi:chemotaxis methyl-accepting protein methylase
MTSSRAPEAVVERVAEILLHRIGLRPDPTLRGRLQRAIRDEMSHHAQDPTTYLDRLVAGGEALQGLLNRITVQETAFFRHPEHFEVLARDVLATLPRPVKIWSAGCANGQEAYSLAMLLEEQDIAGRVIGTDVSTAALQRAAAARYHARELSGLSPRRIASHLTPTADGWQINAAIRNRVSIVRHNLLDPLPPEVQSCHVIFCRNVLIYLSPKHTRAFLDRIADTFPASTPIFLGAAETIWQVSDRFIAVPVGGTFIYRQAIAGAVAVKSSAQRTVPAGTRQTTVVPAVPWRPPRLVARQQRDSRRSEPASGPRQPAKKPESITSIDHLAKVAHDAIAAGDFGTAVVAFRKCAYLAPDDPVAQLHLGLALEAAGDEPSAQRAFAAARQALLRADSAHIAEGFEGYATTELASLLDSKQRRATR